MLERVEALEDRQLRIATRAMEALGPCPSAHPRTLAGSAWAVMLRSDAGEATTEDQRQALRHYRSLFHALLEGGGANVEEMEEVHTR
jgi:hypothetical protein